MSKTKPLGGVGDSGCIGWFADGSGNGSCRLTWLPEPSPLLVGVNAGGGGMLDSCDGTDGTWAGEIWTAKLTVGASDLDPPVSNISLLSLKNGIQHLSLPSEFGD